MNKKLFSLLVIFLVFSLILLPIGCKKKSKCEKDGHTWANATCKDPKYCLVCGIEEGSPIAHTEVIDKGYDSTCSEVGLTDGSHCSVCNSTIKKQEVIEKKNHTWVDAPYTIPLLWG